MSENNIKAFVVMKNYLVIGLILFLYSPVFSQNQYSERGINPGKSYSVSDIETISLNSGNLMLNVPLASLPPGRGGLSAGIGLNYNSKLWNNVTTFLGNMYQDVLTQSNDGGWRYNYNYHIALDIRDSGECPESGGGPQAPDGNIYTFSIVLPDGSKHALHGRSNEQGNMASTPDGKSGCTTFEPESSSLTYFTADGTFLRLEYQVDEDDNFWNNPWVLYMPDGSKVQKFAPPSSPVPTTGYTDQRIFDRNANYIDIVNTAQDSSYNNKSTVYIKDQLDRKIVVENSAADEDLVHFKGPGGENLITRVLWRQIVIHNTYDARNIYPWAAGSTSKVINTPLRVVDKVYLPEQFANPSDDEDYFYEFDYNADATTDPSPGWGEVKSVRTPSGAEAEYDYDMDGLSGPTNLIVRNYPVQKRLKYNDEHEGSSTPITETFTYLAHHYASTPSGTTSPSYTRIDTTLTGPDGGAVTEYYDKDLGDNYKIVNADGSVTEKIFENDPAYSGNWTIPVVRINSYPKYEFRSIEDSNGTLVKTAIKEYSQDKNGNTTEIKEYDFVAYSSIPRGTNGLPTGLPSGISSSLKRVSKMEPYNPTPDASSTNYTDTDSYHLSSSKGLLRLTKNSEVQNSAGTPVSRSEMTYDYTDYLSSNTKAGNITETKAWDSFKGGVAQNYSSPLTSTNSITTSATYNSYGMPVTETDANGTVSQMTYGNISTGSGSVSDLYPTQRVAAYGTSVARTSSATYDFYTGLVTSAMDADNAVTNATEYDGLGRPVKVITAQGTTLESWTTTEYHDAERYVVVRSDLEIKGDGKKVATQFYDQLGRVRLSKSLEDAATQSPYNETDGIKVETRYQTGDPNSFQLTSNPFRAATATAATSEATMGWIRSKSVNTGRHSEVETFSGAALPAPWGSNVNSTGLVTTDIDGIVTTVTDQAGKQRRSITNSLGQLTRIDEPDGNNQLGTVNDPNQYTAYSYDLLNNLTTVTQGVQTRTFTYSSLSRLLSATNPESGVIDFVYDPNGNLIRKMDARGVQTEYVYDALSRMTARNYSTPNGTPGVGVLSNYQTTSNVSYFYDNLTNAKGKLIKVSSSTSTTEYTAFDILGRVTASRQTIDGVSYESAYGYNLSGAMVEQTYPSGRKVKNIIDNNGFLARVQSARCINETSATNGTCTSQAGFWNYAQNFTYNPAGAQISIQLGNFRWESTQFNSRLQPTQIALGPTKGATDLLKLDYAYTTSGNHDNNGNILSQTITVPTVDASVGFTAAQDYTYDGLNRINDAVENITPVGSSSSQSWTQTFTYDRYGNRNLDEDNTTTLPKECSGNTEVCSAIRPIVNPSVNTANNRLNGYTFDDSGNTTKDAENRKFTYDAENKQVKVESLDGSGNPIATIGEYIYDGDGKRIKKYVPLTEELTIFVYDATGKMIGEYSTAAPPDELKVAYLTTDHLGSPRINTDQNGAVIARHDYYPFGEEILSPQRSENLKYRTDDIRKRFTGHEKDNEIELDFAQARHYSNKAGRFFSTDPILINSKRMVDPQQINSYVYVRNNPVRYVDKDGRELQDENNNHIDIYEVQGFLFLNCKKCDKDSAQLASLQTLVDAANATWNTAAYNAILALDKSRTIFHIDFTNEPVGGRGRSINRPHTKRDSNGKSKALWWDSGNSFFEGTPEVLGEGDNVYYRESTITFHMQVLNRFTGINFAAQILADLVHEASHGLDPRQVLAASRGEKEVVDASGYSNYHTKTMADNERNFSENVIKNGFQKSDEYALTQRLLGDYLSGSSSCWTLF